MKSKIIYVDFNKKHRISHLHFLINKIRNYLFNRLNSNYTCDDTIVTTNNVRHIVNKIY